MMRVSACFLTLCMWAFCSGCWSSTEPVSPIVEIREPVASEREIVQSSNTFGIELLSKLSVLDADADNIVISPLSITMALGMALHGAEGETKEEMKRVLQFGNLHIDDIKQSYRSLRDLLPNIDSSVRMSIANSVWYRLGFPVRDEFIRTNQDYFGALVDGLDFDRPEASQIINNWVKQQTNGHIEEIVPHAIDPETMLYLINAIYFHGDWTKQFDTEKTHYAEFWLDDGSTVQVNMMHQKESFRVLLSDELSIIELPYSKGHYSMIVVLPPDDTPIHEFTNSLTVETWNEWLQKLPDEPQEIDIYLPRFTVEYEKSLVEVMNAIGMRKAFSPGEAEFDGIYYRDLVLGENLYISDIMHKTFIDVNEEGTEAAAATAVEVGITSLSPMFRVNRPFLMAIREASTDTILFIGQISNPAAR